MKDLFKSFQRSFKRKKRTESASSQPPKERTKKESLAPTQVGGAGLIPVTPPTKPKRRTWSNRGDSPPPTPRSNSLRGEERHPGRRFTVTEDMKSAWIRGGAGGGVAGTGGGGASTVGEGGIRGNKASQGQRSVVVNGGCNVAALLYLAIRTSLTLTIL